MKKYVLVLIQTVAVLMVIFATTLVVHAATKPGGDTDPPEPVSVCGDKVCSEDETYQSCPADCPAIDPSEPVCGDGMCVKEETAASCPADCDQTDPPETDWECGNGICEAGETYGSCSVDCPAPPTGGGDDDDDDDDDGGSNSGGGSSARQTLIMAILERLIAVLNELIALIISQQAA